jgi:hypothetical protein
MINKVFYLVTLVVRGGVEPPTFRFPGGLPRLKVSKKSPLADLRNPKP